MTILIEFQGLKKSKQDEIFKLFVKLVRLLSVDYNYKINRAEE